MRDRRWSVRLLASLVTVAGLVAGCGPPRSRRRRSRPRRSRLRRSRPRRSRLRRSRPRRSRLRRSRPPRRLLRRAVVRRAVPDETGDPGDEPVGSETPAVGYTPGPTGALAPTSDGPPARRARSGAHAWFAQPAVTQAKIGSTILQVWMDRDRPTTASYTNGLKAAQIIKYGYKDKSLASYEEDTSSRSSSVAIRPIRKNSGRSRIRSL